MSCKLLDGIFDAGSVQTAETVLKPGIEALKQEMKGIKKGELHLHLGGAWPLEFLRKIAEPSDFAALVHFLELIEKGADYHEGFKVFGIIGKIVNTDAKVEEGVYALIQSLSDDNVVHAEIRTGLKNFGSGFEGYLQAVLRGMERGCRDFPVKAGLLLSLRRDTPAQDAEMTVDLAIRYRKSGIVGLDLSGDSTLGDGKAAMSAIKRGQLEGLPLTLHLGESPKEPEERQLFELRELNPKRVGHCVHLGQGARNWILERRLPVEMCLSSALKVQMVESMGQHPALKMMEEGHPVIICTDDTAVFQVSLSDELAFARDLGIPHAKILEMQESLLKFSFIGN